MDDGAFNISDFWSSAKLTNLAI